MGRRLGRSPTALHARSRLKAAAPTALSNLTFQRDATVEKEHFARPSVAGMIAAWAGRSDQKHGTAICKGGGGKDTIRHVLCRAGGGRAAIRNLSTRGPNVRSGWLGNVIGPRRVLTRIVLWWSAFTMLTGAAQGFRSLVIIRFLFGAGEAGAFPNAVRSFSQWFPARERGMANGVLFFGSRLGGAITAPIALLLIQRWGWRVSFVVFGAVGLIWATAWYRSYRDRPVEHPEVDREELAWIQQDYQSIPNARIPTAQTSTAATAAACGAACGVDSTSPGCRPTWFRSSASR